MLKQPLLPIVLLASVVVGAGCSLIDWGDPDGVHGSGWPIPMHVSGLPEKSSLDLMADLGGFGMILNVALALLAGMILWACGKIILRISGRG